MENDSTPPRSGAPTAAADIISSLTERTQLFIFSYSARRKALTGWSPNAEEVLGVKDIAIARDGNLFLRYVHEDDRFFVMSSLDRALETGSPYHVTYRWLRPDSNVVRWLHCRGQLVSREEGMVLEGFILDVTSDLATNSTVFTGPDSVSNIINSFSSLVITLDVNLRILRLGNLDRHPFFNFGDNDFKRHAFVPGADLLSTLSDESLKLRYKSVFDNLLNSKIVNHSLRLNGASEQTFLLELSAITENNAPCGILAVASNVSDAVSKERQVAEARKTESRLKIAAGVAHNLNNSLQSIMGEAAAIKNHAGNSSMVEQASQSIMDLVSKTSDLSKQLFSTPLTSKDLVAVDLNFSTMAAINRLENYFANTLRLSVAFGNPPSVRGRQDELILVTEALLMRARHSLGEGGSLSITTFQVQVAESEVQGLRPGTYGRLSVSDSGLGLSIKQSDLKATSSSSSGDPQSQTIDMEQARKIVRSFGGEITSESHPSHGNTVSMYLPVFRQQTEQVAPNRPVIIKTSNSPDILIIDDDAIVLKTMQALLTDMGYYCLIAEDYRRALQLVREHGDSLGLVLLDAVMPGIDGATLLRRIKRFKRDLKVIGFSGAPSEFTRPLLEAGAIRILRKPVDPRALKQAISETLQGKQAA